jgi:L-asparaginase
MPAQDFAIACESLLTPILQAQFPNLELKYLTDLAFPESAAGTLDSTNLQPADWCLIAEQVLQVYTTYDGWVVLHGTDSVAFTGAALSFLLNGFDRTGRITAGLSKPVILTGAQVPLFRAAGADELTLNFNTDGFQNFCGAVAAAQSGIPEVGLFFENKLFRGNRATKIDAGEFDAFSSPSYPLLAQCGVSFDLLPENALAGPVSPAVGLDVPEVREKLLAELSAMQHTIDTVPVMRFSAFPAPYDASEGTSVIADLLRSCVAQGIKGLVLESYGEGNFPSGHPDDPRAGAICAALEHALQRGVVVVDCTQVLAGRVHGLAYQSGAWMNEIGVIPSGDMTAIAVLAKLTVLLVRAAENSWTEADVARLLQLNLCGENGNLSRLDCRTNNTLLPQQSIAALDGSARLVNDSRRGPVLLDAQDQVLWSVLHGAPIQALPGRLVMQNDGDLVFYDRQNQALWQAGVSTNQRASAWLALEGSARDGDLRLEVFDYATGAAIGVLYSQG